MTVQGLKHCNYKGNQMANRNSVVIGVDFDGTLVEHRYPEIGTERPGAVGWLREFLTYGVRLMLWTMRDGLELEEAIQWTRDRGVDFWAFNENPTQRTWTNSNKQYASIYIDDAAIGCPLDESGSVNWSEVGPMVIMKLERMGLEKVVQAEDQHDGSGHRRKPGSTRIPS